MFARPLHSSTAVHRLTILALVAACSCSGSGAGSARDATIVPEHPLKVVDVSYIDTTVKACTDFFQFAVGSWLAHDTIPAAYSSSGVTKEMTDNNESVLRAVLDDVVKRRASMPADSTPRKLGAYYATCMDSTAIETAGLDPLRPTLAAIDSVSDRAGLLRQAVALQMNGTDVLFGYAPLADPHDAAHYTAWLYASGLGLPDRDYYVRKGAAADSTRQFYVAHVAKMLTLAGDAPASADSSAHAVLSLETELAKASLSREALRVPAATDHPTTATQLRSLAPNVDWGTYFTNVGLTAPVERLNVTEPAFLRRVSALLDSVPLPVWRVYLRYHTLDASASSLSTPFVNEAFAFSSHFSGAKELLPRWKRCLRSADAHIGEALGEAYVARVFPPEAKARAQAVIEDVRGAFRERLQHLAWMSDATKTRAMAKLDSMGRKIGYPDRWRDYSALDVEEGPFVLNQMRANTFEWKRVANRPGKPIDTNEWTMTVPTVNAYYDGSKNEMVFPAGALMPQTFDATADDAANYGSLGGSWAGHELTHGFDDEGRHFDAAGNLSDWWTPADSLEFVRQAALIREQYNGYIQVDTTHVNGTLTLGENIADFGGVLTGYDALQRALERSGKRDTIEGYTPEQRFFIAYAQSWRQHTRDAMLRTRVTVDPHAPARWRANGPLSNMPAFAKAFGCKPGDPMVRDPKLVARIW